MMYKTHLAFGFLLGYIAMQFLQPANQILFIGLALLGSLLPDIDHPRSKLGSKIKIIGWLFEHRGFWHGLFPVVILFLFIPLQKVYMTPLIIGYVSHIVIDALNPKGVMLLHPLTKIKLRGWIDTGGVLEWVVCALLVIGDVVLVVM